MLEVSLQKKLGHFTLDTSYFVKQGVVGIIGASGSGKTITLQLLSGLIKPDYGRIVLNGHVLYDAKAHIHVPSRKRNIGYVFQNYALFPHMTVADNIAYGLNKVSSNIRLHQVTQMIERMHLKGLEDHYPSQLSGGQQQRVALARTLIKEPDLLLLDEPLSAIDNHVKSLLEKELLQIIRDNYKGIVLLVTHNIEEAYRLCDTIMVIDQGQMMQMGPKETLIQRPLNITTARITGCKNILETQVVKKDPKGVWLRAKDLVFYVSQAHLHDTDMVWVGLRAHHLKLVPQGHPKDNVFPCQILETNEGLFSTTLSVLCLGCHLQLEVSKESYEHMVHHTPFIQIPPDKAFLLNP